MAHTERLGQLRENLVEYFSQEELRSLCFDLGVDWDRLRGEEKAGKVTALLTSLDNAGRIPELFERCARLCPNVAWQEILQAAEAPSPFKGLQYFDEADADLFFGRERLTAHLVERVRGGPFLAVVGASGSGKSSIVRAGVVHTLRYGEPAGGASTGSARWPVHLITPTSHPLESLAASLMRDSESVAATSTLMDDLARDPRVLHLAVSKLLKQSGKGNRLLLVVDQFEELFTACKDEAERKAFVDNLLHAAAPETQGPTIIVIALRADFYAHCLQYPNLREALEKHLANIGPMSVDELRCAIEEPARRNGWEFEAGLVDLLLRDVGDEPGALPLLSHALLETWKRRQGRALTLAGYVDCGGVRGAIARTADAVYGALSPDQQQIARNIFISLTELGEGTQDTCRRAPLAEFVPRPEDKPPVEAVLKLLADARLVTTEKDMVEVAHEALIHEWPALRRWLARDRDRLRIHRDLTRSAEDWASHQRDESYLYRGVRLAQATETFRASETQVSMVLNALEREFLESSHALVTREQTERTEQRQRELEMARTLAEAERQRVEEQRRGCLPVIWRWTEAIRPFVAHRQPQSESEIARHWGDATRRLAEIEKERTELERIRDQCSELMSRQEALVQKLVNPYEAGRPIVNPNKFFGREDVILSILYGLPNHYAVYGPRRIGKTSLLHQLHHRITTRGDTDLAFVPVFVELHGVESTDLLYSMMIWIERAVMRVYTNLPKLIVDNKGERYSDLDFLDDLQAIIESLCTATGKTVQIVLLLDEGDVINKLPIEAQRRLRGIFMNEVGQHLHMVWSGLEIQPVHDYTSPWYNLFAQEFLLAALDEKSARKLIVGPGADTYLYVEDTIQRILEVTRREPYLIQRLCHATINVVLTRITHQAIDRPVMIWVHDVETALEALSVADDSANIVA